MGQPFGREIGDMPGPNWDFQVERILLDGLSTDAGKRLGMVIVQPDYTLDPDGTVPFLLSAACRHAQKDLIEKAFQIRAVEHASRGDPVPFILFPELAIPTDDPDGLECLHRQMEAAAGEVIFIGGLEGSRRQEAEELVSRFAPVKEEARLALAGGSYVNACVIAVKCPDHPVQWHFQAKLAPSQLEQGRNMARGNRVLYFDGPRIKFLCLICFDHIAAQGQDPLSTALYRKLIGKVHPNPAALDFVFVPQCNPHPCHAIVEQRTGLLLNYPDNALKNDMAAVVVVNKAARVQEPSEYGCSGLHYRKNRWQLPLWDIGPKGYALYDSEYVTSATFRKRTDAIHVATLVPPGHNVRDSGNPRRPLENVWSYLITNGCDPTPCASLPGTACGTGTLVECDCLPCKLRDILLHDLPNRDPRKRWTGADAGQSALLASHYEEIRRGLLMLNCKRSGDLLDLLFLHREGGKRNPDMWIGLVEADAVQELAAAMSVLRERGQIEFDTEAQWTAVMGGVAAVVVLDGENASNCGDLGVRYLAQYEDYPHEARLRPLLIATLRSTGRVEPIVARFQPRTDKSRKKSPFNGPSPIDEAAALRVFLCREDLFQEARRAPSVAGFLTSAMGEICV
jgi:hypothetical protein